MVADGEAVFSRACDAAGQRVLIQFPAGALGDTIAWFSYAERFALRHRSHTTIAIRERFIALFAPRHPLERRRMRNHDMVPSPECSVTMDPLSHPR
jgi:hypothetical protein